MILNQLALLILTFLIFKSFHVSGRVLNIFQNKNEYSESVKYNKLNVWNKN